MQTNALYFGDNLQVLSERLPDGTYRFPSESVDVVYLDPPFNSSRDYNLIFKEQSGAGAEAQIKAFEDTWHWDAKARDTFEDITTTAVNDGRIPHDAGRLIDSLVRSIGHNDMSAYLVMMTPRLVQLHRVLKATGSLWLHCDPTASHYLKVVLDGVFGPERFINELVWKRTHSHGARRRMGAVHDVILVYGKTGAYTWNPIRVEYSQKYVDSFFRFTDPDGRRYRSTILTGSGTRSGLSGKPWRGVDPTRVGRHWAVPGYMREFLPDPKASVQEALDQLDAMGRIIWPDKKAGVPTFKQYLDDMGGSDIQDVWTDIPPLSAQTAERLGYPTQKPLALLERVVQIATNPGGIVLDPFCGCGTALIAAEKHNRKWVGIDITHLSIAVMRARLMDAFAMVSVPVLGVPADLESARLLAKESKDGRYEFQWWALGLVDAKPLGTDRKKGADKGIDGVITFSERDSIQRILVSVKSGKPSVLHVKELIATIEDQGGAIGLLIELDTPTEEMRKLAVNAGRYESDLWGGSYERIQILTIGDLLAGKKPEVPKFLPAYQKAAKIAAAAGEQQELFGPSPLSGKNGR